MAAQADNKLGTMGSFEITFDDVGDAHGWNNVYPRGEKPEPRYFVRSLSTCIVFHRPVF